MKTTLKCPLCGKDIMESISGKKKDKKVITYIKCEENKFGTFISTIDDLLSCISVAEKALSSLSQNSQIS